MKNLILTVCTVLLSISLIQAQEHGEELQRGERVGDFREASTAESRERTRVERRRRRANCQEDLKTNRFDETNTTNNF